MDSTKWSHFWTNQTGAFDTVMKISTSFFAQEIQNKFNLKTTHAILDYGCGPGFLADSLDPVNVKMTGVDINAQYITQNKNNHPRSTFHHISPDVDTTTEILGKHLKGEKFDFIILLSITQYFEDETEIQNIIKMLYPFLKDNGKLIIADVIDPNSSSMQDALSLLIQCIKRKQLTAFLKFISYLLFSDYRKLSKDVKLLKLSENLIKQIAGGLNLDYNKVNGLTLHRSRTNYVLTKK
ncbi:MAG: class I SAM-dependent methyltransferase [Bacteroidia bacterium]